MSYHAAMPRAAREKSVPAAHHYTNRRGDTYYLHEGRTKTGKPRYFVARVVGEGALAAMPDGFEFTESINGVVSVARKGRELKPVPAADLELVQTELARHRHLLAYKAAPLRGDIVVYQPLGGIVTPVPSIFGQSHRQRLAEAMERARAQEQYDPVFKFIPAPDASGIYLASRMSYRGHGGWLDLRAGTLARLAREYIRLLGTDDLFELF